MNSSFGLSEKTLTTILQVIQKFPQVQEAIVFGSRAKGNAKRGSDIDIALKGNESTDSIAWEINSILNEREPLPYFFDVVNYSTIKNPELKNHIDRVGKI